MRVTSFACFGVALALMGCGGATTTPNTPAATSTAGPGTVIAAPTLAGDVFGKACLATQPAFEGAGAALTSAGFVPHSVTGTYYSPRYDLSVKVFDTDDTRQCSMVFAINGDADAAALQFGEASAKSGGGATADVGIRVRPAGGRTYINARIVSPQ